ncbi:MULTISPECIES: hypothetical protein [unclassified Variovorax]|uniref:hypothetical protein n=1 Tax=unclassified Variovorax TaxID=663243 RepID=UPI00076D5B12|nr:MULTISPECIES: hypothetical protein [unclassified Variovorax]KWT98128.1 hypothetical protein APY03_0799 [Variovorax sp. WDL1]PNG50395.1 hypothetical protein CHC06_06019 [Variovorax sp. B2]PNG51268.1 hypothetical protein CHC07_05925 [Variovorax sp. B4]VTU43151.1 hypothetical protein SRS16P1_00451 [Variovorax sp. SRS16]VTU43182.1 hypothetical protein E5P1_00448 [Variovorax sp. PBL-E5]
MASTYFSTAQLRPYLDRTSIGATALVVAILSGAPHDRSGAPTRWPVLERLTVGQLLCDFMVRVEALGGEIVTPETVAGRACMDAIAPLLWHEGLVDDNWEPPGRQLDACIALATPLLAPVLGTSVTELLQYRPGATGFIGGYASMVSDELDVTLQNYFGGRVDKNGVARLADNLPLAAGEGLVLSMWRAGLHRYAEDGEKLYDIAALVSDAKGRPVATFDARIVYLRRGQSAAKALWTLDAYDEAGLKLGTSLHVLEQHQRLPDSFYDGKGLLFLEAFEVRHDLRGQGLGAELLKELLPLALGGLRRRVSKIAMAPFPLQYDYPVSEKLPPQLVMDAVDAVESLRAHIDRVRPQDLHPWTAGSDIIFLGQDPRATGTHDEQLYLLSEHAS